MRVRDPGGRGGESKVRPEVRVAVKRLWVERLPPVESLNRIVRSPLTGRRSSWRETRSTFLLHSIIYILQNEKKCARTAYVYEVSWCMRRES